MKILLPVDGSDYTKRMLTYIAAHDEMLGPGHQYTAVTAVWPLPASAAKHVDSTVLAAYYRERAEAVLHVVRAFIDQQGWRVRFLQRVGAPVDVVVELVAQEHHDLIVMGSHGHSALGNVLMGSVTTGVLARTRVPVLLVR
jgi:nucleotide-binding universal stress UspA family protein